MFDGALITPLHLIIQFPTISSLLFPTRGKSNRNIQPFEISLLVKVKNVQDGLHKDVQTTLNIYTHLTKNQKNLEAEKFSNYPNF